MSVQAKIEKMSSKLEKMVSKLEEEDKDPVLKKLNEEAVSLAAREFFGEERGREYIEVCDLAESTMGKKAKSYVQNVINPEYFGNTLTANIIQIYKVIFRYSKFFGMINKHKKILTRSAPNNKQ